MPEYLSPGVYVEEIDTGAKPIEGVSTSTAGFVGMAVRGPTSGLPVLVTSFPDYVRKFGAYLRLPAAFQNHVYLPYAVEGFFTNRGQRVYIIRVKPASAAKASVVAKGGLVTRLKPGENAATGQAKVKLVTLRGIQAGSTVRLRMIKDGATHESDNLTVAPGGINRVTGEVTLTANVAITSGPTPLPPEFDARHTVVFTNVNFDATGAPTPLATPLSSRPDTLTADAKDEGSWGNEITVQAYHDSAARSEFDTFIIAPPPAVDDNRVRLKSGAGFYVNAWVEIDRGDTKRYRRVKAVNGPVITLYGAIMAATDFVPVAPATSTILSTCEFRLVVGYNGVVEQYPGLTLENVTGRYCVDQVNNASTLIALRALLGPTHPALFPSGEIPSGSDGLRIALGGGSDGTAPPTDADYRGTDPGPGLRTGIKALEDIDQISIIAAPGITTQVVQNALITQCEELKDRFAILDPKPKTGNVAPDLNDVQAQRNLYDTKYAALYYPRLVAYDPVTTTEIPVPPSGHVAGIYARSDVERGVHKAPANEVIGNITGLELTINKREHDILNPSPVNINVLRDFRSTGRGYRVWGARVITSDPDWKYVNVRRLFIFVEESIEQGTQWVVFEPNDEPLWARVRRSVTDFLTNVWRDGALQGRKAEEAFFVKCDRTTMTQYDIDNGRLIMVIGIAPVKPAEFVIFRIGQWAGGSEIAE